MTEHRRPPEEPEDPEDRAAANTGSTIGPDPLDRPEVVIRAAPGTEPTQHRLDLPATPAGALAALGSLVLLSSLAGTLGAIGYQRGVGDDGVSVAGFVAGLVVLLLGCLIGGWTAGRMARHRGPVHGLLAVAWLVVLAAALAVLAALAGDEYDVTDRVGVPAWFSQAARSAAAVGSGALALLAALLGGLLGGWLGGRSADRSGVATPVEVVETRHGVRHRLGGIGTTRRTR